MTEAAYFTPHNDAADAARMLTRIGMVALAIGVPASAGLGGYAMSIMFAIGIALLFAAEALYPAPGVERRFRDLRVSLLALAAVGFLVWAAASLSWTPFPNFGLRRIGIVLLIGAPTFIAILAARPHIRAADLYLFPIGVVVAMGTTLALGIAGLNGVAVDDNAGPNLATAVVVGLFPAMAGLSSRGRNGLARFLVIVALGYTRIAGTPGTTAALLVGFASFSFALSDAPRTSKDLGWIAAAMVLLAPLAPLTAPGLVRLIAHADLATLPQPGPALQAMSDIVLQEPYRLLTGHGLEAAVRAAKVGVLPAGAPHGLVFEVWYDLGLVGAAILAFGLWRGFRAIDRAKPRVQPYLMATLTCIVTLAFANSGWGDETWLVLIANAAIAADCAMRGQYGTKAPSAVGLAHF